ncbi:MAG: ATP-dependent sacrificial sulfur transferase LarE [Gemmatimonadetes bacterium]|nr:ATP-dependent sacrificial sulfur transferase LarE [Gemmatimonadota bacterium]
MSSTRPLAGLIASYPSILVGYSGGVDSALLAVVARRVLGRDRAVAAIGLSPSFAEAQYRQAQAVARQFDLNLIEMPTDELADPGYAANPTNRCYFCKRTLWRHLLAAAQDRGIAVVADGTNVDDLAGHRPGHRAGGEAGIRAPLVEAGYTKVRVRREARRLGIPIWNAPAAPCLSSRVMYGLSITPERLRQVEVGEGLLRSLGVRGDLRVRHRGDEARIEVAPEEFGVVRRGSPAIAAAFRALGFVRVTLDLRGYRSGSQLSREEPELELLPSHG